MIIEKIIASVFLILILGFIAMFIGNIIDRNGNWELGEKITTIGILCVFISVGMTIFGMIIACTCILIK